MATADKPEDSFSAAASLFDDEASADLFSFAASSATPTEPPAHESEGVDPGLFGDTTGQDNLFISADKSEEAQEQVEPSEQTAEQWEQQETAYDYSQQGYYDEEGTWHWYEDEVPATTEEYGFVDGAVHEEQPSQYVGQSLFPAEGEYQAQYASYDAPHYQTPYQPADVISPALVAENPVPSSPFVPQPTTYDAPTHTNTLPAPSTALYGSTDSNYANGTNLYEPASAYGTSSATSSSPSNAYAPVESTSSVYDPYKPTQTSRAPPPTRPKISHKHTSSYSYVYNEPLPPKPAPPPAPNTVKSSLTSHGPVNAYDPPLPPITRSIYDHGRGLTSPRGSFELYPSQSPLTPTPAPPGPPPRSLGPQALSPRLPPGLPPGPPRGPVPRVSPFMPPPTQDISGLPPPSATSSEGFSYYPEEPLYEPAASSIDAFGISDASHHSYMVQDGESHAGQTQLQQGYGPISGPEDEPNWGYAETLNTASHLEDVPEEAWPEPQRADQASKDSHFPEDGEAATDDTSRQPQVLQSEIAQEPVQLITASSEFYGLDDIPTFGDAGVTASHEPIDVPRIEGEVSPEEVFDLPGTDGNDHHVEVKDAYDPHFETAAAWQPDLQSGNWNAVDYAPPHVDQNKEPWLASKPLHAFDDFSREAQEEINLDDRSTQQSANEKSFDPYAPPPAPAPAPYAPPSAYVPASLVPPPPPPLDWHTEALNGHGSKLGDPTAFNDVYTSAQPVEAGTRDPYAPSLYQAPAQPSQYPPSFYGQPRVASPSPMLSGYTPPAERLGTDDPLGRIGRVRPVVAFAFGGRILTCFEQPSDVVPGLLNPSSRTVRIQNLSAVIPPSALDTSTTPFPGPLFQDQSSSTLTGGFARGTGGGAAKSKKAALLKYLDERAAEIQGGLAYLSVGEEHAQERRAAEGKLVIVRLLKVLVENDGKLSGSPAIENAVRIALVPDSAAVSPDVGTMATPAMFGMTFGPSNGSSEATPKGLMSPFMSSLPNSDEDVAVYRVRRASLDKLQQLLLRGDRRSAVHYALDERLWAHALVIASSLDKDAWKEAVNEFIRSELGPAANPAPAANGRPTDSRESLRIAYSLFAGNGAASVQELLPPKLLMRGGQNGLVPPTVPTAQVTPMSPNFPQPVLASNIPAQSLEKWREAAATIVSNQATGNSAALTALGDYLVLNNWIEAAHVCYMLSPQTSPMGASGAPSVRIVLLGAMNPSKVPNFHRDLDGVLLSEILEFAYSLTPVTKGQEPFVGFAHLQPYRLLHALQLAEMGNTSVATRYVDSIQQVIKLSGSRVPQLYSASFLAQLKDFQDRLTLAPQEDKLGFWGAKGPKPTLDSFGTWVGTNLTKFIAGEGDSTAAQSDGEEKRNSGQAQIGPFSHYSAISSAAPSNTPSPHGSTTNLLAISPTGRAGSAMSMRAPPPPPFAPIDRAASAMDRPKPKGGSPPRTWSADALTTAFDQAGRRQEATASGGWWNASGIEEEKTPSSNQFTPYAPQPLDAEGFISLMDSVAPSPVPVPAPSQQSRSRVDLEDDEDLGFGNSKKREEAEEEAAREEEKEPDQKAEKKDATPQKEIDGDHSRTSSSWFRGWFGGAAKKDAEPQSGAVKANLGEENAFYYDKDLKRWVNKKGGGVTESPKPATPPPRAQTTSPGMSARARDPPITSAPSTPPTFNSIGRGPPPPGAAGGPPRSMSAVPPRMRSNLAESFTPPTEGAKESGITTPPMGAPPPRPATAGRSAGKKNVRSRYVDVFNQPQQ